MMPQSYTVIIPCFNAKAFILDAVNSALDQSLLPTAVIVIDDGSTDGSAELLDHTFRDNKNVVILRHPNHARCGVLASRKLGLSTANTEWVAFLDADDIFAPDKLAYQFELLTQYPNAIMLHTSAEVVYAPDMAPSGWKNEFSMGTEPVEYRLPEEASWMDTNRICNSTALVRRVPLLAIMNRITPDQVFQYEDWLIWGLLGFEGSFVYGPSPVTRYRLHSESATAAILKNRIKQSYSYLELLIQLLLHIPETARERFAPPIGRRFRHTIRKLSTAYAPAAMSKEMTTQIAEALLNALPRPQTSTTDHS